MRYPAATDRLEYNGGCLRPVREAVANLLVCACFCRLYGVEGHSSMSHHESGSIHHSHDHAPRDDPAPRPSMISSGSMPFVPQRQQFSHSQVGETPTVVGPCLAPGHHHDKLNERCSDVRL